MVILKKNIKYITSKKIGKPNNLLRKILSNLSEKDVVKSSFTSKVSFAISFSTLYLALTNAKSGVCPHSFSILMLLFHGMLGHNGSTSENFLNLHNPS